LRPDAARTVLRPFIIEDPSTSDCPRTRRVIDRILALDDAGLRDELQVLADAWTNGIAMSIDCSSVATRSSAA
jgi:hypothetical protein